MDRTDWLRILGLPGSASDDERRAAWWTLRAHIEARLLEASAPEQRASRERELRDLEVMWSELGLASPRRATHRELGLLAWAAAAALLALVLGVGLLGEDAGPRALVETPGASEQDTGGAGSEAIPAAARAKLVANARVGGARIEIKDTGDGAVVASGPADDSSYWLVPGRYALRVSHADCGDSWEHVLEASAGGEYRLAPGVCGETAWLVVQANVEAASVEVDGRELGATGAARHALEPGERAVRVGKPGFQQWEGIVELEPGREVKLKPRLAPEQVEPPAPAAPNPVAAAPNPVAAAAEQAAGDAIDHEPDPERVAGWHHETRHWLLARYDRDRSGRIDSADELDAIPCDYWQGIERSYDASRLGLSLTRVYGFDGDGWKPDSLGIGSAIRDLAFQRLRGCGLRY